MMHGPIKINKKTLMGICSLSFPARNALTPYCHLWLAPLNNIFPRYLIKVTIFEKVTAKKCVFWFYLQLLYPAYLILG